MKTLRKFGTLGVAMIVAVASLMLGATPASAAGYVHYENVGNPGWCLDGNGSEAYLHRCGHGDVDFQQWFPTKDMWNLELVHAATRTCLTALTTGKVTLRTCGEPGSVWDAPGKNGWVKLVSPDPTRSRRCVAPSGTWEAGKLKYDLIMVVCDPYDIDVNVPNLLAWRWFV